MTEEDMEVLDKEIEQERADGDYEPDEVEDTVTPLKPTPVTVVEPPKKTAANEEFEILLKETDDQKVLAKSMTKFFDSLVEEGDNERSTKK